MATVSVPDIKDSYESVIWNRGLISVWSHGRQNMLHLSFFYSWGKMHWCTAASLKFDQLLLLILPVLYLSCES